MILYIAIAIALFFILIVASTYQSKEIYVTNGKCINPKRSDEKILFCLIIIFLWVLTAFRGRNIGNDTITYLNYLNKIKQSGLNKNYDIELGYQLYCLIIGKITKNENAILIVTATICYFGVGAYTLKYSHNLRFSLILLFCICFSAFTNTMRQSLAMIMCLFAYECLKRKKHLIFILLVLMASTFHISALIVLILLLNKFFSRNIKFVCFLALALAILSASDVISSVLQKIVPSYENYFNSTYKSSGWLAVSYELARALVFCLIVFKVYSKKEKQDTLAIANFSMLLFLNCLGYSVNLFTRASEYFLLMSIVEIPNAVMEFNWKKRFLLTFGIGFVMIVYFIVVLTFRPEWNHLYPYEFWS